MTWTFLRWVPLLLLPLVTACTDKEVKNFFGSNITSNYPAASSASNTNGSLAFSPDGLHVDDARVFNDDADPRSGVVLFTANGGTALFAANFVNGTFSPPVEITGENQDDLARVLLETAAAMFLHGPTARSGDALVLFRRKSSGSALDTDGDGDPEDDANARLYSFYYDRSQASLSESAGIGNETLIYGFSSLASFVDADLGGDDDEEEDEDVGTFGFVSDGLVLGASYDFEGRSRLGSGDDTSFVYAVYQQGPRVRFTPFDLLGTTIRFDPDDSEDLLDAAGTGGSFPTGFDDGAEAGDEFVVHNGLLLWSLHNDGTDSDTESIVVGNVFSASGVSATQLMSRYDADPGQAVRPDFPSASNVYGDDHGASKYWMFYEESGFDDGNTSTSTDVLVCTLQLGGSNVEMQEIDAFPDGGPSVQEGSLDTAMSRSGSFIYYGFLQPHLAPEEENGALATTSVFVGGADTRGNVLLPNHLTGPIRGNADVRDAPGETSRTVFEWEFQTALADGLRSPTLAFQSNRFRTNIAFVQGMFNDEAPSLNTSANLFTLHTTHFEFDAVQMAPPQFTTSSGTAGDTLVDSVDASWRSQCPNLLNLRKTKAVDAGNGSVALYYLNQGNHKNLASAVGDNGQTGSTEIVDAVLLEIPISAAGGPSFSAGEIIALSRIDNGNLVGNEPGCAFLHLHALGPFEGTRGIDIDGIGPYLEPTSRHPVCGYGPITTLQITIPGDGPFVPGDMFAAYKEVRLFVWRNGLASGAGREISRDGSLDNSPAFYQVESFEVVPTPIDANTQQRPNHAPTWHNVFMRRSNSNIGSPAVLDYRRASTVDDLQAFLSPAVVQHPVRVDQGFPVHVDKRLTLLQRGNDVDLYYKAADHLFYNGLQNGAWQGATIVDDDHENPIQWSHVFRPFDGKQSRQEPTLTAIPAWTKEFADDDLARLSVRVRFD